MASLPAVLDIRDDLDRAREDVDEEHREELAEVGDRLEALADRDRADPEGVLDEIDNQLLRIETQADGEAERRLRASRNRIHLYRESLDKSEGLTVLDSRFREADATGVPDAVIGGEAALRVTVANEEADRDVRVEAVFYGPDGDELEAIGADLGHLSEGEQATDELDVTVPPETEYYVVTATEAGASA